MKRTKIATLVSSLVLASGAFAGTMGPVSVADNMLFITGEGAYTWDSIKNTVVQNNIANKTHNGWGGRIGAGVAHHSAMMQNLSYTAEAGWGYYDTTKIQLPAYGINARNNIYGVDLLVGADYLWNQVDFFGKVGAMIQNVRMKHNTDLSKFIGGTNFTTTSYSYTLLTQTSVVPEIKVGGAYNFNEQWAVSVAYMGVYGNSVSQNINKNYTGSSFSSQTSATGLPVTLNTVIFGLRYSFA